MECKESRTQSFKLVLNRFKPGPSHFLKASSRRTSAMRTTIEVNPAVIDYRLSEYAKCIGIARFEPIIEDNSAKFKSVDSLQNPRHKEVFFVVYIKYLSNSEMYWLAIDKDDNCYVLLNTSRYTIDLDLLRVMMPQPEINIAIIILAKEAIKQYIEKVVEPEPPEPPIPF